MKKSPDRIHAELVASGFPGRLATGLVRTLQDLGVLDQPLSPFEVAMTAINLKLLPENKDKELSNLVDESCVLLLQTQEQIGKHLQELAQ